MSEIDTWCYFPTFCAKESEQQQRRGGGGTSVQHINPQMYCAVLIKQSEPISCKFFTRVV